MTDEEADLRKRIMSTEALELAFDVLSEVDGMVSIPEGLEDAIVAAFDYAVGNLDHHPGYDIFKPFLVIPEPVNDGEFSLRVLDERRGRVRGGWTQAEHAKAMADKLNRNWRALDCPLPRLSS